MHLFFLLLRSFPISPIFDDSMPHRSFMQDSFSVAAARQPHDRPLVLVLLLLFLLATPLLVIGAPCPTLARRQWDPSALEQSAMPVPTAFQPSKGLAHGADEAKLGWNAFKAAKSQVEKGLHHVGHA
ncbi:hypothetical protein BC940DRAFT_343082 [Gongronella butleri]|nr:hypothetical protein BC940DRAFT_343082 [Gongronella butleri]